MFCDLFILSTTSTSCYFPILRCRTRKGLTTPLTHWVASICYLCAGAVLRGVRRFSYWFDNLGLITEENTYRRYTSSSLPLWGNTDVVLADIKRNFWRRCRGGSLITNLISSQFTLFSICLSFPLPHFTKFAILFAIFFVRRFLVRFVLECNLVVKSS